MSHPRDILKKIQKAQEEEKKRDEMFDNILNKNVSPDRFDDEDESDEDERDEDERDEEEDNEEE